MRNAEWFYRTLLLAVVAANAAALWPDLAASQVDLNDNVSHFAMVQRIAEAVEHGGNPLDAWSPEWAFGYPMLRVYQTLPHLIVAGLYFALLTSVPLLTVFVWVRFLAVLLVPVTFFATARRMQLPRCVAFAAALLAPLISTNGLYGLEFGSYLWAGNGLFPQSVAAHFLLLTIGLAYQALRNGKRLHPAGICLGMTFLCHFIYGYIGALSVCVMALMPGFGVERGLRIRRTAWIAITAILLAAFQLAPLLLDGKLINHSRWEPAWKWDSFGGGKVLQWLVTGELLDHGRLPVLSLLALLGALLVVRDWRAARPEAAPRFVLYGAVLWLLLFFGRPFWGPLLWLFGISPDMQLHRLIGGVHVFLLLLAAIGFGRIWQELAGRKLWLAIPVASILLLSPALQERGQYLENNKIWSRANLAAYEGGRAAIDATIGRLKERGGRVYPGLAATWGSKFKVGDVPLYGFLSDRQVPAVAFLYHSMALPGDLMPRFDEWNAAQYRLFGIRTVAAPAGLTTPVPPFWSPLEQIGRFQLYRTPETGYFDLVDVPSAAHVTRETFFDVNDRWLSSEAVARREHLLLDLPGGASFMPTRVSTDPGRITAESQELETYRAEFDAMRPAYLLFKMNWHPNWKVELDGERVNTAMLSPGFVGIFAPAGHHRVVCRYEGGGLKIILLVMGLALLSAMPTLAKRLKV